VAGTHSGVGKTTVATGIMAALRARGVRVGAAKVGPDYIDPGYHALATGRPGRNLDAWMCGAGLMAPLAARAGVGTDLLVIEGVMGLFDGAAAPPEADTGFDGPGGFASSAHIAHLLDAPVVLVVDASAMSDSVAAIVHGYATLDPRVHLGGVMLNRVGSEGHERMLRDALERLSPPVRVLGVLRRDQAFAWADRHLGLVPVVENRSAITSALDRLAATVGQAGDLEAIVAVARSAPSAAAEECLRPRRVRKAPVPIAVAAGPAFSFVYADNLEALAAAGAECLAFDPTTDERLPAERLPAEPGALYAGGGFPEEYAGALAANAPLLAAVKRHADRGLPIWAECGGLLWLARSLDGRPMAGLVPTDARMTDRLTLGYRHARLRADSPLGPAGIRLRGHEFHYSRTDPPGDGMEMGAPRAWRRSGWAGPHMVASYLHTHLASDPGLAERFVAAAAAHISS